MKTIAFLDLGTNSCRLAIVEITMENEITNEIARYKTMVRLGSNEFQSHHLTDEAMERTIYVLKQYALIAERYEAKHIYAVATSAVREADNKQEFISRVYEETGIEINVVSGIEEARLIYLGVSQNMTIDSQSMFIDIGGGSTELIGGDNKEPKYLDSCKLGAIRMNDMFFANETGTVTKQKYNKILDYVMAESTHSTQKIKALGFKALYGSSGTITNLGEITARRVNPKGVDFINYEISYKDLKATIDELCSLTLEERKKVPGINPQRADIIIAGAVVLDGIMRNVGAKSIIITDYTLREGLVVDYLNTLKGIDNIASSKYRSVLGLCKACRYHQKHAERVVKISQNIFDQLKELGLHNYGDDARQLLGFAAILHDIGSFISIHDHNKHSYYLIKNWRLSGFSDETIEIIAAIALCHRKQNPVKAELNLSEKNIEWC